MINFWLRRKPHIHQQLNPYADFYGKWYIVKRSDELNCDLYLHKDGIWRITAFNINSGMYSGYFDTEKEAKETLDNA